MKTFRCIAFGIQFLFTLVFVIAVQDFDINSRPAPQATNTERNSRDKHLFDRLNIAVQDSDLRAKFGLEGDDAIHNWTYLKLLLDFSVRDGESVIILMPTTMFTRESMIPQPIFLVKVDEVKGNGITEEIGKLPPTFHVSKFQVEERTDNLITISIEGSGGRGKEKIVTALKREPSALPWERK